MNEERRNMNATTAFEKLLPPYYVGLCTKSPTASGTGANCNELEDCNGYVRVKTAKEDWEFTAPAFPFTKDGVFSNVSEITFKPATGSWNEVKYFALFDSAEEGNMLFFGQLDKPICVKEQDVVSFQIGHIELDLTL